MESHVIKQRRVSLSESGTRDNKESSRDKKSQDHDSINCEHVAAIAAATFAIHLFEEKMNAQRQEKEKGREVESSMRTRPKESYANTTLSIHGSGNTKVDAWEKSELLKIKKRYEKNNLTVLEWEKEKKTSAKRRVEEKKKELDKTRSINWQHYQNKLARIDHVAGGARSQAEKNRNKEEQKIKERAKERRSLGVSSPKYCFLC